MALERSWVMWMGAVVLTLGCGSGPPPASERTAGQPEGEPEEGEQLGTPVAPEGPDAGEPRGNEACVPHPIADTCREGVCGTVSDGCGGAIECQACSEPTRDAGGPECVSETFQAFCSRLGKNCGKVSGRDNCGVSRTYACGFCDAPQTCGGSGNANVCGCTAESDARFCARLGKDCGDVTAEDGNCGTPRTVSCGTCSGVETCGENATNEPNVCGCVESGYDLCARNQRQCGTFTATDKCGQTRTVSCGNACTYRVLSVGARHGCAVENGSGRIVCWGDNAMGQATAPTGIFTSVSAGESHTCGIQAGGAAKCWGDNSKGQSTAPAGNHSDILAGGSYTCATTVAGVTTCFGGQVHLLGSLYTSLSLGRTFGCGIMPTRDPSWNSGKGFCFGELAPLLSERAISAISAGSRVACYIKSDLDPYTDGKVVCSEAGSSGEGAPPQDVYFRSISVGTSHACGLGSRSSSAAGASSQTAHCWGSNEYGQAKGGSYFSSIHAGDGYTCGLRTDGTVSCWGRNDFGQTTGPR